MKGVCIFVLLFTRSFSAVVLDGSQYANSSDLKGGLVLSEEFGVAEKVTKSDESPPVNPTEVTLGESPKSSSSVATSNRQGLNYQQSEENDIETGNKSENADTNEKQSTQDNTNYDNTKKKNTYKDMDKNNTNEKSEDENTVEVNSEAKNTKKDKDKDESGANQNEKNTKKERQRIEKNKKQEEKEKLEELTKLIEDSKKKHADIALCTHLLCTLQCFDSGRRGGLCLRGLCTCS